MNNSKLSGPAFSALLAILCTVVINKAVAELDIKYPDTGQQHMHEYIRVSIMWLLVFVVISGTAINYDSYRKFSELLKYCLIPASFMFVAWIAFPVLTGGSFSGPGMHAQYIYATLVSIFSLVAIPLASAASNYFKAILNKPGIPAETADVILNIT